MTNITSFLIRRKGVGRVLKGHMGLGSCIPSTHKPTLPSPRGSLGNANRALGSRRVCTANVNKYILAGVLNLAGSCCFI